MATSNLSTGPATSQVPGETEDSAAVLKDLSGLLSGLNLNGQRQLVTILRNQAAYVPPDGLTSGFFDEDELPPDSQDGASPAQAASALAAAQGGGAGVFGERRSHLGGQRRSAGALAYLKATPAGRAVLAGDKPRVHIHGERGVKPTRRTAEQIRILQATPVGRSILERERAAAK